MLIDTSLCNMALRSDADIENGLHFRTSVRKWGTKYEKEVCISTHTYTHIHTHTYIQAHTHTNTNII